MLEPIKTLFYTVTLKDVVDILIVSVTVYYLLKLIKGTRGFYMLIGLGLIVLLFPISSLLGLFTVHWLLDKFLGSLTLLLIVVFQHDIRRVLTQVGRNPFFRSITHVEESQFFDELSKASLALAGRRIGAIIVIEREAHVHDFIEMGTIMDAKLNRELLLSLFHNQSPVHDGAMIIQKGKVVAAGCWLPLSRNPNLSKDLGTRHRAAVGLTEETDSVVIVVSEETGKISIVVGGKITRDLDLDTLRKVLRSLLYHED